MDRLTISPDELAELAGISLKYLSSPLNQLIEDMSGIWNVLFNDGAWHVNTQGDLVPKEDAAPTLTWAIDENGDFLPQVLAVPASFWDVDENGDILTKTSFA